MFRCQLPHDNPYYVDKSEEEIEEDPDAAQYTYHLPEKGTCILRARDLVKASTVNAPTIVFFCAECGMSAPKRCSACKSVHYCSVDHQREHWSRGHKEECDRLRARAEEHGSAKSGMAQSPNLFDEWEIITEEEPSDDEDDDVDVNSEAYKKKLSRKYKELKQLNTMRAKTQVREPGALPEDFPVPEDADEEGSVDDSFIAFQHRIKRAPNQILRQYMTHNPVLMFPTTLNVIRSLPSGTRDGQAPSRFGFATSSRPPRRMYQSVLIVRRLASLSSRYCSPSRIASPKLSSKCAHLHPHLQILPQLLHYMEVEKVEREGLEKALNWGTVVIYSCPNSCPRTADSGAPKSATYSEEFAWRQNMD